MVMTPLFDWLVDGAPGAANSQEVAERVGTDLAASGIPVDRFAAFVRTLHPQVLGRQFIWVPGEPVRVLDLTLAQQKTEYVKSSPVADVVRTGAEVRRRIERGVVQDYPVVSDLAKAGFTDYVCMPMQFMSGQTHAVAFASKAATGFQEQHLLVLRHIVRPLSRVAEILALRRTASNLLSTYVGRNAGDRILSGRIHRGDIETVRAIIWFSDMRGFTEMSAKMSPRTIIDTLNELFDCQVGPIEKRGGEILKFIGDGLLALFPVSGDDDLPRLCTSALDAADEAFTALALRNDAAVTERLRFGLALHVGEVAYGNIGGDSRLDFTAIGPAVNLAARLEGLTGKLGRPVVVSEELARHASRPLADLGTFELKGVREPQRVFATARVSSSPASLVPRSTL
jgi:adenylate cyclase